MEQYNIDNYKNIIFDLGGVIINLDVPRTIAAFARLCREDFNTMFNQLPFFEAYEKGEITCEEFRAELRTLFHCEVTDEQIDEAWNAMLLDIPAARIELIRRLAGDKRLFLLSNTNAIHKKAFEQIAKKSLDLDELDCLFEKAYYSHLAKDRKPNESIFKMVLAENNLDAGETLFIDDGLQHVEAARRAGINAIHLVPPTTILDIFESYRA